MSIAESFWPIAEDNMWVFQASTTEEELKTIISIKNVNGNYFDLLISKNKPYTYWGPELSHDLRLYCVSDNHGIYMLGYEVEDFETGKIIKRFTHNSNNNSLNPWLIAEGVPVYAFIQNFAFGIQGQWRKYTQYVSKPPEVVFENSWETRLSVEPLYIKMIDKTIPCLRVDYLETNTPLKYCNKNVLNYNNYEYAEEYNGPGGTRPIRVNETWWWAWGIGPVRIHHEHNNYLPLEKKWSPPIDTHWKYGPIHAIELESFELKGGTK